MKDDNKKLFKYLGLILIAALLTYKLPHKSYSIIEYIIRPIRIKNSTIYLSGLMPLILIIVGTNGIGELERFKNRSKILIFILVLAIIMPIMHGLLDRTRTAYHWLSNDGLVAIDMIDNTISTGLSGDEIKINTNLELKDYGKERKEFKVKVHFPKTLEEIFDKEYYVFKEHYWTHGNRQIKNIEGEIIIKLDKGQLEKLFNNNFYIEQIKYLEYELFNEKERVRIKNERL